MQQGNVVEGLDILMKAKDKNIIVIRKRFPATTIKEYLNQTRQTPLSSDTVKKRLCSVGLKWSETFVVTHKQSKTSSVGQRK